MELDPNYKRLREAIFQLQEAALAIADVEVAEIRFTAPRHPMHEFHCKLLMETPAIDRPSNPPDNPNEMLRIDGIVLTKTVKR